MSFITKIASYFYKNNDNSQRYVKPVTRKPYSQKTRLTNVCPWDYYVTRYIQIDSETKLELCVVVGKPGSIQMTFGFRGHDIDSFSEDYIAQVFEFFNSQLMRLSDGWAVMCESQRFKMHDYPSGTFSNIAAYLVDREREEEFKETGEHYDSSYYLTFTYKPEREIKRKVLNFFYKEKEIETILQEEIDIFVKKVINITSVLSGRMMIRPLDCKETVTYLHSTVSRRKVNYILPKHFLYMDRVVTDEHLDIARTLMLGENYIPILNINDFPIETYPAILNILNKLDIEYRWTSRFIILDKKQTLKELEDAQKNGASKKTSSSKMASEMILGYQSSIENHSGVLEQSDAEDAQEEIGGDINRAGYLSTNIMVYDKDYSKAMAKLQKVRTCIEEAGFSCLEENINSYESFLGMMPGNYWSNIRRPMVTTGNYSHMLPFCAIWSGLENNRFLGDVTGVDLPLITCATNYGSNFYLNTNDGDVGHTLILGPTGAGKSTLLCLYEISALKYPNAQVFIMDYGLSSLTLTLACGGVYVNPADSDVSFQPFRYVDDEAEFAWASDFVKTIIEMHGIKVNGTMELAIDASLRALSSMPPELRTFSSFMLNLEYTDENGHRVLDDALSAYTLKGRYGHIFDGDRESLRQNSFIMFEMEHLMDLGKDCSAPAILYIFHFLEKNFTGRLTFFFMDECWFGLENEVIVEKMKQYLYTLRKKNVFCIFATQNPAAVAESSLCTTMVQNCPTQIFLADPKANKLSESYSKLGLSEEEINLISMSTKKRDYYYKSPQGTRLFQLNLGVLELALFRNKESKIKMSDGKILPWYEFLKALLKDRKKSGRNKCYVDRILDIQGVPFRQYLEKYPGWEEML